MGSKANHGTVTRYRRGCRCDLCRAAKSEDAAAYSAANREKRAAYRLAHREEQAAYRLAHREERAAYSAAYEASHKAERAAARSARHAAYRADFAAFRRARKERERGSDQSHTAADIRAQHARQHGRCFWCKAKVGDAYHVDHVVPLALGGSNGPENIVIACAACNLHKSARHPMDFAGRLC